MVLVILYLLYCSLQTEKIILLRLFSLGFIGVDIFFFFSAFGLCFSFSRNSIWQFYTNRLIRIIPLFFLWAVVHLLYMHFIQNVEIGLSDILFCCSSVSYYGVGAVRSNWYLSALIMFYILFPSLFYLTRKFKEASIFSFIAVVLILLTAFSFEWYHQTFISRFPIFLLGIYAWLKMSSRDKNWTSTVIHVCLIMAMISFLMALCTKGTFLYLVVSLLSPATIFILSMTRNLLIKIRLGLFMDSIINFVGRHSLEFFIGNCWTMLLMNEVSQMPVKEKVIVYLLSNVVFALALIPINHIALSIFKYKIT